MGSTLRASHAKRRAVKVYAKKVGLLLVSLLISLLLAEGLLHLAGIGQPVFRDVDPILGTAPVAGAEGMFTREGHAHVQITEHGFRGVDVAETKPPGVWRLAVLGDSYTEAKQVELEDAFPSRLQTLLDDCDAIDGRVEVLNFGIAGHGTAQQRLVLEHHALGHEPDAVLLAFLTGNDITDNHPGLRQGQFPYYVLEDGELVLNDDFKDSEWFKSRSQGGIGRWFRRNSRIYQLVRLMRAPEHAGRGAERGLADEVYCAPSTDDWRDAWDVTEALLARMHADLAARDVPFLVATLSSAAQVDPDPAIRTATAEQLGVEDLDYADRRVAEAGERDGYPVLNLAPGLRAYAEAEDAFLHGFENTEMGSGHWNVEGHRQGAERIAPWLCERLTTEPEPEVPDTPARSDRTVDTD